MQETAESPDVFGWALATGDFNGDGFADLAVGAPGETIGAASRAGIVHILYGSANGLAAQGNQVFHQDRPGVQETAEGGDTFGWALATGDFNGDGFADLAIGAPGEAFGAAGGVGVVHILYGSANGLTTQGSQIFHQDRPGVQETAESPDVFGFALTTGDFNGDSFADLAVGAPGETIGATSRAGIVHILYGTTDGLSAAGDQVFHQDSAGIPDFPDTQDFFGWSTAAADFDNDGFADLAIEVPGEDLNFSPPLGAVHVLYGTNRGMSASGNPVIPLGRGWTSSNCRIPPLYSACGITC